MHFFGYRKNELYAEDVPVSLLAEKYGTPLYVYSRATLVRHVNAYHEAFAKIPHIVCFALKSNSNVEVIKAIASEGAGADIVSGGELYRALRAGVAPGKIVYAGVGKTEAEIASAIKAGILMFNVESGEELAEIGRVARKTGKKASIALRVNPDVDPKTHPYISTGMKENKFGIPMEEALEYYRMASAMKTIEIVGIHKHIGSQLTKVSPFVDALEKLLGLVDKLNEKGMSIRYIDIGGGLGITYKSEKPPLPKDLARKILPLLKGRKNITLVMEPGRSIVGNAGILVSKVLYNKPADSKHFLIVDAGMNDLMRPSLYDAYHEIVPVADRGRATKVQDVVGPICESGDFLAKDRKLPSMYAGELLAVMSAGAYGFSMSSTYNSRPRAAEVMVSGKKHALIRKRETHADLVRGEGLR